MSKRTLAPEADQQNRRGIELLARGDHRGAVDCFNRAIQLTGHADAATLYYNRGTAKHLLGDCDGAIGDFHVSLAIDPNSAQAHNNRGMSHQIRGALAEAMDDFEQAIAMNPQYVEAFNNRGIARRASGDRTGAVADFEQAIKLNPNYAEAYNNRGITLQAIGEIKAAIADFDRAIGLNPSYADAYNNRGTARHDEFQKRRPQQLVFINRNTAPNVSDDLDDAIADFNKALSLVPHARAATIYHNRASARQSRGDLTGAIADFGEALTIDPNHAGTYTNRATARKAIGDLDGALADLDHALRVIPRHGLARVYHNRGGVLVLKNEFVQAIADYNSVLEIDPNMLVTYLSRGNARYHGRDQNALDDYWHALKLDPRTAAREIVQMLVDDLRHDQTAVLRNCDKHLRINPKDLVAYGRRGLTRLAMGDNEKAKEDLASLESLCPAFKPALELLVREVIRRRD